jgi:hypothetical protein
MGGRGTVDYFPLGKSLVVSQTPDIHEQSAMLLQTVRDLTGRKSMEASEESEPKETTRPKRRPNGSTRNKKVSELLEKCHEAIQQGRSDEAARLIEKARKLDADAVDADPFVYKMGLLDQVQSKQTAAKPFIQPPLPRFDPGVLAALQRWLVEMTESPEGIYVIESAKPSGEEEAEPMPEREPEAKLLIDEAGAVTIESENAEALKFANAVESLRSAVLDKMTTAVCAEVDHTKGPTRGRINLQFGEVQVRAAWDAEGHGSLMIGMVPQWPDAGLVRLIEWVSMLGDAVFGANDH